MLVFPLTEMLEGIQIVKVLGRLHSGDLRIGEESHQLIDEIGHGNVIGIQGDDEFTLRLLEGVIEVSCLSVDAVFAGDVIAAKFSREGAHLRPVTVVQNVSLVGILNAHRAHQGFAQEMHRLVVRSNQDVYGASRKAIRLRMMGRFPGGEVKEQSFQKIQQLHREK